MSLFILYPLLTSVSQTDTIGQWFTKQPLPTPRQEVPHAVLNGRIYVPGGLGGGGIGLTVVEVFNPGSNTWTTVAPLPEPLHHLGFAAANGRLYVLGGYMGSTFNPTNRVYEFLPDSNLWQQKTSMSVARGAHIAITYQGKIYVIGGVENGAGVTRRNDVYDPVNDTWDSLAPMPTAREHLAGAVIDTLIYVVGGRAGGNVSTLESYSSATDRWYSNADMPTARSGLAATALRGRIYAFGGEIPGVYEQNEEYDPTTNSWKTMAPMPTPRHGIGAATVEDSIFIIGGAPVQGFGVTDVNEMFVPPAITGIAISRLEIPQSVSLSQNYPNPFNPITNFEFRIAVFGFVSLKIYDVSGQVAAILINGTIEPGIYSTHWNAKNYSSGIYFCRLSFVGKSAEMQLEITRKMILMK